MKISSRHDIRTPQDYAFQAITDFDRFESQALRQGIEVVRTNDTGDEIVGTSWRARFTYNGKNRSVAVKVIECQAPSRLRLSGEGNDYNFEAVVETMSVAQMNTRIFVSVEIKPRNMRARLLIQTLRLAKNSVNKRFAARLEYWCEDIENTYQSLR